MHSFAPRSGQFLSWWDNNFLQFDQISTFIWFCRWGQTPLTEAILFKHTKVASMIKRHENALKLKAGKLSQASLALANAAKSVNGPENGGDMLWRKLVERNMMKPEKEKPVYKVSWDTVITWYVLIWDFPIMHDIYIFDNGMVEKMTVYLDLYCS